jgi:hypothetical protein
MQINVNGENADINDSAYKEKDFMPADCRVRVLLSDTGKHVITIDDPLYHIIPYVVPVANNDYTYTIFADAVNYCRDLGYKDQFSKNRFSETLESNLRVKKLKLQKWWIRTKAQKGI